MHDDQSVYDQWDNESIFWYVYLVSHAVYSDDCDNPSESRFATLQYSIKTQVGRTVSWLQDRNRSSKSKKQEIDPTSRQSTLHLVGPTTSSVSPLMCKHSCITTPV